MWWSRFRRLAVALGFVLVCFFSSSAASWASGVPTPSPMPTPYGVPMSWTCNDRADPDPLGSDCAVTSWGTVPPAPTVTATETATVTPTADPGAQEVILAPGQWAAVDTNLDVLIFGIGGLLMLAICWAIWTFSRPAMFGSSR